MHHDPGIISYSMKKSIPQAFVTYYILVLSSLSTGFGDEGFEVGNCGRGLLERIENLVDVVSDIFKVRAISDDNVFVLVHVGGNFDNTDP